MRTRLKSEQGLVVLIRRNHLQEIGWDQSNIIRSPRTKIEDTRRRLWSQIRLRSREPDHERIRAGRHCSVKDTDTQIGDNWGNVARKSAVGPEVLVLAVDPIVFY